MCFDRIVRSAARASLLVVLSLPAPLTSGSAQAQAELLVRGRVTDHEARAIAGAQVGLADAASSRVLTGADGRYQLRVPAGTAPRLRAAAIGYAPAEVSATAGAGVQTVNFALQRAAQTLPEISITAAAPDELAGIPGSTSIIGADALHQRAPLSVMDALRTVPGVTTADEDPYGLNLNVGIRGLPARRSSRTLLLEDGVPILLGPYGDPSMHYAPPRESLERIEVIKGSGQIANGPQTVGGVLNMVTAAPPAEGTTGEITVGGGAFDYRNARLRAGSGRDGRGVSLDYAFREGDGVRDEQAHRMHNAMLKGLLPIGGSQSLLLKGTLWDESSRISETGLTQEEFEDDPFSLPFSAQGRFNVRRYLAQAIHDAELGRGRLRTNAYFSNTNRASWRQSGESEERLGEDEYAEDFNCQPDATSYDQCGNQGRPREYTVFGLEPRLSLDLGERSPSSVELGLRLHSEDARRRQFVGQTPTSREADAELTRDNQVETTALAGFAVGRLGLGQLTVSPGLRIERVIQDISNRFPGSEATLEQSYTQLLPGIGVTYNPRPGATLFAGVHRGFAPPRPADIYSPEPGQSIVLVDPETSWNWEAGVRLTPRAGLGVDATLFQMNFGNEIIEAAAGDGQRFTNGGRTTHRGFELAGHASLAALRGGADDVTVTAAYTFVPTARFDEDDERGEEFAGNRLPYAPRHLLSGSVTFTHRSGLSVGTAVEHTGEQFGDEENSVDPSEDGQDGILPGYTVTHAFAGYAIPRTRVHLRVSVRNVFDEVYITQRNEGIYTGARRFLRGEVGWMF